MEHLAVGRRQKETIAGKGENLLWFLAAVTRRGRCSPPEIHHRKGRGRLPVWRGARTSKAAGVCVLSLCAKVCCSCVGACSRTEGRRNGVTVVGEVEQRLGDRAGKEEVAI